VKSLPILISTTERSDFSRSIDGKTHHGKGFVCGIERRWRIQIYVARDDISTDEEKTMYNVVFKKLLILAILLGFVERFSERRWVKSLFIFMA
jgi:hypothetical protein